jgi:cytochrome c-type biogenesis protein CcmH/NrfG
MPKVSLRAYNREIEAMIDRNHLDEAIAHCQHILKTFPRHLETYRLLGKAYLEAKRYDEAADIFSRVLAAEPADFVAHVGMSIIRDEQNKLDDAIWHMERAFDVQSANPAIQAELQRLYGRRDGLSPARIRLTRGALANMYMRGELYPQAIAEARSILEEDPGRTDMQVLLARAYFQSGQKKDAADAASAVLKRYPHCREANLILAEIFNADRPEQAALYRQRVIELDPYAAQADSLLHAAQVSDAAISIEQLEWRGQEISRRADWDTAAIALESAFTPADDQPDWLKASLPQEETPLSAPTPESPAPALPSAAAEDDIPDFLRAAGWGVSTGAFDESKASALDDELNQTPALAEADLPEWIKAMAPPQVSQPAETPPQEEELPDWISKIGTDELPIPSSSPAAPPSDLDWLTPPEAQPLPTTEPQPESQPPLEDLDWLKSLEQENLSPEPQPAPEADQPDWLKDLLQQEQPSPAAEEPSASLQDVPAQAAASQPAVPAADAGARGTTEQEQDDALAWLEALAAKQGATEGLLTRPEERREEAPDWVKQAQELQPPAEPAAVPSMQTPEEPEPAESDVSAWLKSLDEEQPPAEPLPLQESETAEWLKSLEETPAETLAASAPGELPAWLADISEEKTSAAEPAVPAEEAHTEPASEELPAWLNSLAEEEAPSIPASEDLPAWLRDETGELLAEPTKIEPTRPADWKPADELLLEETQPPQPAPPPAPEPKPEPKPKKTPRKETSPSPSAAYVEPVTSVRRTGMLSAPADPLLGSARTELSRSNIPAALEAYGKLIKKGRFLEEVIFDLREALYRYPVEVSIWQTLGDAYMRANQLQDALDAYTKAEELLR